jgi:hypothetical protein
MSKSSIHGATSHKIHLFFNDQPKSGHGKAASVVPSGPTLYFSTALTMDEDQDPANAKESQSFGTNSVRHSLAKLSKSSLDTPLLNFAVSTSSEITKLDAATSKALESEPEDGWPASRSALGDVVSENSGILRIECDQLGHCGINEHEAQSQPPSALVSTPVMSLEKSRRSYADVVKPIEAPNSSLTETEISQEPLARSDAVYEKAKGMAQNLGMTLKMAVNFLNPFSSDVEKKRTDCFEVTWDVLFRPEILKGGKLQMCLEYTSVKRMVHLSPAACERVDKIQKAVGKFNVPMNETIQCTYFITYGSEQKRIQESTRFVSIPSSIPSANLCANVSSALTLDILDDINIFKRPQVGLQELFNYRLNHFLQNLTASRFEIGSSISFAISRLDQMLSIKVTGVRSGCEDRFGPPRGATRIEIRRVVAEWCMTAVIDSRDKEQKSETCIFCSAILGYFDISSEEIFKSAHRARAVHQCFEEGLGSKMQADRRLLTLDARSQELALSGVALLCHAMVQSRFYGWMSLLYLLDLDSEDKMRIFSNVEESSFATVRQDTMSFADALRRSGLTREDKGARLVLKHVPSISALLKDPNVTALFRPDEIAARLAPFIPRANNHMDLSRDLQLVILEWLTSVSTSAGKQVWNISEAQSFTALLSTIFSARMTPDSKIDCMLHIANILANASGASTGQDLTVVLRNSLHVISDFVLQLPKPASYRSRADKIAVLRSVWSPVFEVETIFDGAVANPPPSSTMGQICLKWLNDVDDKEFIQLFALILDKERDRNGVPNRKLSARLRRCREIFFLFIDLQ